MFYMPTKLWQDAFQPCVIELISKNLVTTEWDFFEKQIWEVILSVSWQALSLKKEGLYMTRTTYACQVSYTRSLLWFYEREIMCSWEFGVNSILQHFSWSICSQDSNLHLHSCYLAMAPASGGLYYQYCSFCFLISVLNALWLSTVQITYVPWNLSFDGPLSVLGLVYPSI